MTITKLNPVDSGWKTLQLSNDVLAYDSNNAPRYRKVDGIVFIDGAAKPAAAAEANAVLVIGTLPVGYRPEKEHLTIMQGSVQAIWLLRVLSNGNVRCERYRNGSTAAAMSTTTWLPCTTEFVAG